MGKIIIFPLRPVRTPAVLNHLPEDLRNSFRCLIENLRGHCVDPLWPETRKEQLWLPGMSPEQDDPERLTED